MSLKFYKPIGVGSRLDVGAIFRFIVECPLQGCESTRLLIEANRSEDSTELFSIFQKLLPEQKKNSIKKSINPYRSKLQKMIEESKKPVLHLSIHSFTPVWNNEERMVDIGILFDPNNKSETNYSHQLKVKLEKYLPDLKIRLTDLIAVPMMALLLGYESYIPTRFIPELNWKSIKVRSDLSKVQDQILNAIQATLN
ncbi:MAG: hypothetical protein IPJ20_19265 [Flammeovirgaceae bacterium]|nr:hypothetical protein [Flammeovirgaceae bacterium]